MPTEKVTPDVQALAGEAQALLDTARNEQRDLTAEESERFAKITGDLASLRAANERQKTLDSQRAYWEGSTGHTPITLPDGPGEKQEPKPEKQYRNFGEWFAGLQRREGAAMSMTEYRGGNTEQRADNLVMGTGSLGGYLVPEQFRNEIMMVSGEAAIVRPRAQVIPAGSPPDAPITMPAFVQGSDGVYGGVAGQWIGEAGSKPQTDVAFSQISLEPKEYAAYMRLSDKLLRNSSAMGAFVTNAMRNKIAAEQDYQFLRGDGIGKPLGVLNAAGKKNVARNTSSDVKYEDILGMMSVLLPGSLAGAVWVANITTMPKIAELEDGAGNNIFINGDATKSLPATLAGVPLLWNGKMPTLGNEGDLCLVDFSYYLIKDGSGPFVASSEHVHFTTNETVIKAFVNVDGQPWVTSALTLEDGSTTVSPYVILK